MIQPNSSRWRARIRCLLRLGAALLLLLALAVARRSYFAFRDRMPGYALDLEVDDKPSRAAPRPLRAGFARVKINPDLANPQRPVYLAGFNSNRKATAIHDDLWAIACVLDDGHTRLGLVALDAIGFFHDDVVRVRQRLLADWKLNYTIVCSTHNHSTPDLMGLWGPHPLRSGVDPRYREQVIAACVTALGGAVSNLQPARLAVHEIPCPSEGLVADARPPRVFDPDIRVLHFIHATNDTTLGTVVGWANHPETPWSRNTEITSDFCGYLRDALEHGVTVDGQTVARGLGGVHLYVNGAIGGLMTTSPGVNVHDPYLGQDFQKPSHEKARAVGHQLASRILPRLSSSDLPLAEYAPLSIRARTIGVRVDNNLYLAGGFLGLLDRGYVGWRTVRSEVALVTVGEASLACVPGELYPEIANGGIESPAGADYAIQPVEVPPLRELMPGRVKFLFGLANDEVGYLLPKTQWDRQPPFTYGARNAPYGEINSCGPDAAGSVHAALAKLCRAAAAAQPASRQQDAKLP
ncbi:MAG: hypothetical protein NTX51_14275 [Verrucomicrobia bacterium]|nr:hypothetical protein [Verrucomicrobiota bacterium]